MKRAFLRRGYLAVLLITGLIVAGCGDTLEAPSETLQPRAQSFEINSDDLAVAAPGQPIGIGNFVDPSVRSIGAQPQGSTSYIRHASGLVELLTARRDMSLLAKEDATWSMVRGLAGSEGDTCFSFESFNFPGEYLRHQNSRVIKSPLEDSDAYRQDATWCTTFSLDGATDTGDFSVFSFESFNFPGRYLRQYNGEIWLSQKGGPLPSDDPNGFEVDASWGIYLPLKDF